LSRKVVSGNPRSEIPETTTQSDFVSGNPRSEIPETTTQSDFVSGNPRSEIPETTTQSDFVSGNPRSEIPETTTLFREWSAADFPKQRKTSLKFFQLSKKSYFFKK